MNVILSIIFIVLALYFLFISLTMILMSDEDYNRHRKLLLHPELDAMGDTITSVSIKDGKWVVKKRASIGATKRLLHNVWGRYD